MLVSLGCYIALERIGHHVVAMCLSSGFSLAPQIYASNLHAERAPVRVICSFLIAMVLRHFQICHEQSSTKEPKCFCGMWSGHWISFNLAIGQSSLVVMPTAFQNCRALVQPKMMCAVSSGPALQRFHCQLFFSSPNSVIHLALNSALG